MLHIITWLWGSKWPPHYVDRLFAAIRRNLKQDHRLVLITDRLVNIAADAVCMIGVDADAAFLARPGCLVRMRMFDRALQARMGATKGDRIVCIDIDAVITGNLDPLFDRDDEFTIMQGFNSTNPCPFNGSLWMFRAGERHDVWDDFSIEAHAKYNVPVHAIPDDQGWLALKFPDANAYTPKDGVYAFKKKTWPGRFALPSDARVVAFPGRDPGKYLHLDWVKENWRC